MLSKSTRFKIGPFNVCLNSSISAVNQHFSALYFDYPLLDKTDFIDLYVAVNQVGGYRRWYRPQAKFSFDGYLPFLPLPLSQAPAFFEWGLNWCIANIAHQYLIIHAAVVEKGGKALIMPGSPGSGKSTLCAALVCQGWRLLSDEMVLLSLSDGLIYPSPRPVSLKNKSISIIQSFAPNAVFGNVIANTSKGDIAHMCVPTTSVAMQDVPALPGTLLFPHYRSEAEPQLQNMPKSRAFMFLAENAFNFNIVGSAGFEAMADMIGKVTCYDFIYPDLTSALSGIGSLT